MRISSDCFVGLTSFGVEGTGPEDGVAGYGLVEEYAGPLEYAAPEALADDQRAVHVVIRKREDLRVVRGVGHHLRHAKVIITALPS